VTPQEVAPVTTIGIIGAGEVGSEIARAAVAHGYRIVIANSRGPETLTDLVSDLGPAARAARAADAAVAGDFAVVAVPLKRTNDMPVDELAGKIVLDTNNHMAMTHHGFDPARPRRRDGGRRQTKVKPVPRRSASSAVRVRSR
jgi:predicted dinucleotide-binding enzyme